MLNINPTRNISRQNILNFKGIKLYKSEYNNLKPLAKDTVSFRGVEQLNAPLLEAFQNLSVCREIFENGKLVENDLRQMLEEIAKPYMYDETENPDGIVQNIETRVKAPNSLREKAVKKLAWAIKNDTTKTFNPESIEDVKKNCGDIIGGRIILRKPSQEETSKIIDSLIKKVETGELKITKIENYISGDEDKEYFKKSDLERLKSAVNSKMGSHIDIEVNEKATGYMALHLDIDLSNDEYRRKNDNYKGEIQIVGYDVSKLKDVEDLCYKLKGNNKIKGGHPAYKPFSDYFNKFINSSNLPDNLKQGFETFLKYNKKFIKSPQTPDFIRDFMKQYAQLFENYLNSNGLSDEDRQNSLSYLEHLKNFVTSPEVSDVKEDFETYTKRAYGLQRLKDPSDIEKAENNEEQYAFPTPEECGIENLPQELDFNNLAHLKQLCDNAYKLMEAE